MSTETPGNKEVLLQATAQELGPKALETVKLSEVAPEIPEAKSTFPEIPTCITQAPTPQNLKNDPAALVVGLGVDIPRWKPGSVVRWTAWQMGFNSLEDANYAAIQMEIAAEKWNNAKVGVTFEFVNKAKDANFIVSYGGPKSTVLASAYFPNERDLNFVFVYAFAFDPAWRPNLAKVFIHELGHVLGLRHEFALDPGRMFEGQGAVQFGERNEFSVMNYRREAPELQPSDISATTGFYKLPAGTQISGSPIVDHVPH